VQIFGGAPEGENCVKNSIASLICSAERLKTFNRRQGRTAGDQHLSGQFPPAAT